MEAIILAGGLGKRLQSVVKDIPKPMADINGKPFLCYIIDYLSAHGIKNILLSVGYKQEIIKHYFGSKYHNSRIHYAFEEVPLGTGGAIQKALNFVRGSNVVVLNGDTFFAVDLKKMMDFHVHLKSTLTLAIKPMHDFNRYGTVELKGNEIIGFREKTQTIFGYINGGIYIINKSIIKHFCQSLKSFSFEVDFLRKNLNNIMPLAFKSDSYFIDIGIPVDYKKAQRDLAQFFKEVQK
jgi:D-glycero-alpha-D-manno-heptose 1-phosphate guanylyltransferase